MSSPQRHLYKSLYILSVLVFAATLAFYVQGYVSLKNTKETKKRTEQTGSVVPREKKAVFPLDINEATPEELEQINGIGPVLAGRIITFRVKQGGFRSLEELKKVKGIGPVTYKEIHPFLTLDNGGRP